MAYKDPEKKKEYDKKYREQNKEKERLRCKKYREKNKEKERLRARKYREQNKEKENLRARKYYEKNKEKERLRGKKYYEQNKEKEKIRQQKYKEQNPEKYHKCHLIGKWKYQGLIVDDPEEYESLYYLVMSTENCEGCNCILTGNKPQTATSRCLDHCHITGKFRAVLCKACNVKQPKQPKQKINNININEII